MSAWEPLKAEKKHLASEEKSMEKIKATVENIGDKYFIKIKTGAEEISIPMSEDKPNEVKSAFNKIITRIKAGEFQVELDKVGEELFSQVANEYLTQLNREIQEIHGEMKQYGLVNGVAVPWVSTPTGKDLNDSDNFNDAIGLDLTSSFQSQSVTDESEQGKNRLNTIGPDSSATV